jgi:hypothetical protein
MIAFYNGFRQTKSRSIHDEKNPENAYPWVMGAYSFKRWFYQEKSSKRQLTFPHQIS